MSLRCNACAIKHSEHGGRRGALQNSSCAGKLEGVSKLLWGKTCYKRGFPEDFRQWEAESDYGVFEMSLQVM